MAQMAGQVLLQYNRTANQRLAQILIGGLHSQTKDTLIKMK